MTNRKVSNLSVFLLALIILIIEEPLISRIAGGAVILGLMALFVLLNLKRYISHGIVKQLSFIGVSLYIIYIMFYEILGLSNCDYIYYYYTISFMFFAFAVTPLLRELNEHQQCFLIATVIISLFIAMVSNMRLSTQYGSAYIRLADINTRTNAISTQYVSALILFCGIIFTMIHFSKKMKIVNTALFVFAVFFIITVGQRATAIILLFVMLMMQFTFGESRTIRQYAIYLISIVVVVAVCTNYEQILRWVAEVLNNDRITQRINQLLYALKVREIEGSGGSLEVRFNLMMNSLNTFTSSVFNFFFGIGENRDTNELIGHHSEWLDHLAKYGTLGTVLLIATLKRCLKETYRVIGLKKRNPLKIQFIIIVFIFVIRGLIGSVLYPYFGIQLFVFMPIIFIRMEEKNEIGGLS